MSSPVWEAEPNHLRAAIRRMDAKFQRAVRRAHTVPKAKALQAAIPAPLARQPRDVLDISTPIHKLPFSPAVRIIAEVCEKHRVSKPEIFGQRREKMLVIARHEAFYRLKTETTLSLPAIGMRMGGKDHSTVHNGIRKHMARMAAQ